MWITSAVFLSRTLDQRPQVDFLLFVWSRYAMMSVRVGTAACVGVVAVWDVGVVCRGVLGWS